MEAGTHRRSKRNIIKIDEEIFRGQRNEDFDTGHPFKLGRSD